MIEILRDPLWQFIGALLALLAVVLTIFIFLKERAQKRLTYQITSFFPLLTLKEEEQGDFTIFFKGSEIRDLFVINVEITNSGNVPITSHDYEKPVALLFGESSQIYSAEVVNTQPQTLSASLSTEEKKVVVSPVLMNSGDSIKVKVLVTSPNSKKILADGRIVGVKEITEKRINMYRYFGWVVIGTIIMMFATVGMILTKPAFNWENIRPSWPYFLLLMIGLIVSISGMIGYYSKRGFRSFLEILRHSISSVFKD